VNDEQRRHLTASVRYVSRLLEEAERAVPRLPENRRERIGTTLEDLRGEVTRFSERFAVDVRTPEVDPLHVVRVQLAVASVSVFEMRARSMRGYGPLDSAGAADLDSACDALDAAIQHAQHAVDSA